MNKLATYRRLFSYLKPYRKQLIITYLGMLIGTGSRLFIPQIIRTAIDEGIESGLASTLYRAGAIILGIAIISGVVSFLYFYYGHWLSHRVAYDLRNDLYESIQSLPFSFHDDAHTGDLMSRATSDIREAEFFTGIRFAELVSVIITITGVIFAMLTVDVNTALVGLIPIPILVVMTIRFGGTVRPMFKGIQEQLGSLSTTMQESLTGIRVVKAFAREPYELEKFDDKNEGWYIQRVGLVSQWANNWPFFTFLVMCSVFLLLWVGGPKALDGDITIGSLFALISYVLMLQGPVQNLGFVVNLAATAGASASRVFEIMDMPNEIENRPNAIHKTEIDGNVAFKNVSFAYSSDRQILNDVTFKVTAGQKVALVGPTGSGKSTITNLLPRFYEITDGSISIDGVDIRDFTVSSLRSHIGTVLQDSFLYSSTIGENIAYGRPDASQDEIVAAARAARAHEFINGFPEGYDTVVGERGVTLSGGQKQRVAIARTLLMNPQILILDDATSSVDTETEHLIQQALQNLMENRTTFIIAQRLLTLKHADQIFVVDGGRITERGTHDQLLANRGLYKEIYDLQLKDQEEFAAVQANLIN